MVVWHVDLNQEQARMVTQRRVGPASTTLSTNGLLSTHTHTQQKKQTKKKPKPTHKRNGCENISTCGCLCDREATHKHRDRNNSDVLCCPTTSVEKGTHCASLITSTGHRRRCHASSYGMQVAESDSFRFTPKGKEHC